MSANYQESDKMFDVICDDCHILQMMCRFGISLGVGEKTVREVCTESQVHIPTFLALANYLKNGTTVATQYVDKVSVPQLIAYLKQAHNYFLNFQLPSIRRKLINAIDNSGSNELSYLILKYFDEYMGDVRRHMDFEDKKVFVYVNKLLAGSRAQNFSISRFARSHVGTDKKLQELKNLIIKYYTATTADERLNDVLFDIFNCEEDLRTHCYVEDDLFVPAVELIEEKYDQNNGILPQDLQPKKTSADYLSDREREIVACIVKGLSNKEIADHLFISANTVLTHRKNIFRKLDIHSVSGLTIYAIVNGLVKLEDVKL